MTSFSSCDPCYLMLDLGCVNACGEITLQIYAPVNGIYTFIFRKAGVWISKEIEILNAQERFTFKNFFPENAETEFKILDPDGQLFKYNVLRDKFGITGILNPPDDPCCCTDCIIYFKVRTVFNFELVEEPVEVFNDVCDTALSS